MDTHDIPFCVLCYESDKPFTVQNYCPLDGSDKHVICCHCRDHIQTITGNYIPVYNQSMRNNPPCFGCGLRFETLRKRRKDDREYVEEYGGVEDSYASLEQHRERINSFSLTHSNRSNQCFFEFFKRILEGFILVVPIVFLTLFYSKLVEYLVSIESHRLPWDKFGINSGFYILGFFLGYLNYLFLIVLSVYITRS